MKAKFRFWVMLVTLLMLGSACRFSDGSPGSPPDAVFAESTGILATHTQSITPGTPTQLLNTSTTMPALPTMTIAPVETVVPTQTIASTYATEAAITATPGQENTSTPGPTPIDRATATSEVAPTQTMTASSASSPLDTATLSLSDDFEGGGGWVQGSVEGEYTFGYINGAYQFDVSIPDTEIWTVRSQKLSNLRQEITITNMTGDEDGYFGLICRWEKPNSYYRFSVTPSGTFKITRIFLAIETDLAEANLTPISEFSDQESYRIRADCTGNQLLFYLNQQQVLSAEDSEIRTGQYGMLAEA
ncbi:MAG: hypothetical protein ACK2UW_20320, partial [Anaerolineales bacterium]